MIRFQDAWAFEQAGFFRAEIGGVSRQAGSVRRTNRPCQLKSKGSQRQAQFLMPEWGGVSAAETGEICETQTSPSFASPCQGGRIRGRPSTTDRSLQETNNHADEHSPVCR